MLIYLPNENGENKCTQVIDLESNVSHEANILDSHSTWMQNILFQSLLSTWRSNSKRQFSYSNTSTKIVDVNNHFLKQIPTNYNNNFVPLKNQ